MVGTKARGRRAVSGAAAGTTAPARAAAGNAGDVLDRVGRIGVAGLGVLYLLLGWVAAQVALGGGEESADNTGALRELAGNTAGKGLLWLLVVAFAAYALWQATEAATGFRHRSGSDRTKKRVVAGVKAVFGAALALSSLRIVTGSGQESSSDQQADLTARVLEAPGGPVLVVVAGLAVIALAGYFAYRGWTKKFLEKLDGPVDHRLERLGQAGYLARSVAFGVLGALVVVAGVQHDPQESRGLDAALTTLAQQPFGTVLLLAVALGFAAYGVYSLLTARRHKEG